MAVQRYEGASTLYGPHTLAAYINVTLSFLPYLAASSARAAYATRSTRSRPTTPTAR